MTIQFQGPGGFNERYFNKQQTGSSKLGQALADQRLTQKELVSLRQDYLSEAAKAGLNTEEALNQFNLFMADSLDGNLSHQASQAHLDVITDLGFLFDEQAAVAIRRPENDPQNSPENNPQNNGELSLESGRIDENGFHAAAFGDLATGALNAEDRQARTAALWSSSLDKVAGNVFRSADNTKGRYVSPQTLIARHQSEAAGQKRQLRELEQTLYTLKGQPGAEQAPLKDDIERYQTLHDLLSVNQRVHETFAANPKRWGANNLKVDTQALSKLNSLLSELELMKVRIDKTPDNRELKRQWQDLRNSVQAVTLALGNSQYTAMSRKQPLDLHVTSTSQRYEIHKLDVRQKERRDVDASPQGFVRAKILEGQYDDAYAYKISTMLDELDQAPAQTYAAKAQEITGRIEQMLRPSIIGDAGYRQSILDMVEARVISRGVQLRLPAFQQRYEALSAEHARLTGKAPRPDARAAASKIERHDVDGTRVKPLVTPTWQRATDPGQAAITAINELDPKIAALRNDLRPEITNLQLSNQKADASDAYIQETGTRGSAVGALLSGRNAGTRSQNAQAQTQLESLQTDTKTLATDAASFEAQHWKKELGHADELYLRRIFDAASKAKEGTALYKLGECYKAMGLYHEGDKWQKHIDMDKLKAKINELSQDPEVQKTFEDIKQAVAKEVYSPQEIAQITAHLRSSEFREHLYSLPKAAQQQELQQNLQVLAFADPKLAAEISDELLNAYVLERPESVLDNISPYERRSAFELALNKLGDGGAMIARAGVGARTARDMLMISAAGKAKIAEAMANIPVQELRTCFDHVDLMKLVNQQLVKMGTDVAAMSDDLATLNKLSKSGRITGFGLTAAAAVGHIGEGLLSGELLSSLQAYGAKVAQGVGGIFAQGTDVAKLAASSKDIAQAAGAGSSALGDITGVSDELSEGAKHLKGLKGLKLPSWVGKAGGQIGKVAKYLGPIGEAYGIYNDTRGMVKDFSQGDAFGGSMKGIQAGAGITGLGTGVLVAAGFAGPAAPLVIGGALVVGIGAWLLDESFGKSDTQSMLEGLGVYK